MAIENMKSRTTVGAFADAKPIEDKSIEPNWWNDPNESAARREFLGKSRVVYRPLWNVKTKLLTAYRAQLAIESKSGHFEVASDDAWPGNGPVAMTALDRYIQQEALANLYCLVDAGHKVLLVLPVHFSTMDDPTLIAPFVRALSNLSADKQRLVVLEMMNTREYLPKNRIKDAVARIRQPTRSVMARIPMSSKNLSPWAEARVHAVGFEQSEEVLEERVLLRKMGSFVEQAEAAGLNTFAYGLKSLSMVTAAVYAGFNYIEGAAVRPPAPSPSYVTPFESEDLFCELLGR